MKQMPETHLAYKSHGTTHYALCSNWIEPDQAHSYMYIASEEISVHIWGKPERVP